MKDKIFVDTNILVHLANEDSPLHLKIKDKFSDLEKNYELWVSRQVLREYAVIMTREGVLEKPFTPDMVSDDIDTWELLFLLADETAVVTINLQTMIRKYSLKGKIIHDANIVATMLSYAISKIFTLNQDDFKRFKEIEII